MQEQSFYAQLGRLYDTGRLDEVERYLAQVADKFRPKPGEYSAEYAMAMNELGSYYRETQRYGESEAAFLEAIRVLGYHDKRSADYATALANQAGTCRLIGDHQRGLALLQEALDILSAGEDAFRLATVYNGIGLIHQDLERYGDAVQALQKALELIRPLEGTQAEVAAALANLSVLQLNAGDVNGAWESAQEACARFQNTEGGESSPGLVRALNTKAAIAGGKGDYQEAIQLYDQAYELIVRHLGRGGEALENRMLARQVCDLFGELDSAVRCQREVVSILRQTDGPDSFEAQDAARDLILLEKRKRGEF